MWEGYYIFRLLLWSLHSTWRHFHLQQNGEVLWRHHHFLRPYGMIISHYFHHCCMRSSQVHKNLWQNCHSLVILANSHSLKTWSFLFSQKKKSIFFFHLSFKEECCMQHFEMQQSLICHPSVLCITYALHSAIHFTCHSVSHQWPPRCLSCLSNQVFCPFWPYNCTTVVLCPIHHNFLEGGIHSPTSQLGVW